MKAAGGGRVDLCHVVNLFDGLLDIIAKKLMSYWHCLVAQRPVSSVETGRMISRRRCDISRNALPSSAIAVDGKPPSGRHLSHALVEFGCSGAYPLPSPRRSVLY